MPIARFQMPDGRIARFEVPEGTTPEQAQSMIQQSIETPNVARDPNEVDQVTGKTRAQLESELDQYSKDRGSDTGYQIARAGIRGTGRLGRNVTQGIMALPSMIADSPAMVYNAGADLYSMATGNQAKYAPTPFMNSLQSLDSQQLQDQGSTERLQSDVIRGLSGAAGTMGMGGAAAASANPITAGIGATLSNPVGVTSSTIAGSLASGVTREAGGGPIAQTVAGMAGGVAPGAASWAAKNAAGWGVRKLVGDVSPDASLLRSKGVDLTGGQLNQGSIYSNLEDGAQRVPVLGQFVKAAKDQAKQQAKEAFIVEASAPGTKVNPTGDLQKTLSDVADTFLTAYDQFNGFPLRLQKGKPVIMKAGADVPIAQEIGRAIADKGIDATSGTRTQAASWLGNLLSRPVKKSQDLFSIRSEIRSKIGDLMKSSPSSEDMARIEIYQRAEKAITESIESQLPPDLLPKMKAVDAQYAKYIIARDAVAAGKDRPGGFTFSQASDAVKKSAERALGKNAYAKGMGAMRDIPAAAQSVFAEQPANGSQLISAAGAGIASPLIAWGTLTEAGRNAFSNQIKIPYRSPVTATLNNAASAPFSSYDRKKK